MSYTDPDTDLFVLTKQPWEELRYDMDFSGQMRDGDDLSSVSAVVITNMGQVVGSGDVTSSGEVVSGDIAQVKLSGGTDLENYKITIRAITTDGDKIEGDGMLYVREQ